MIDSGAKGFAAVPSVARVGTGSYLCNCDHCEGPFTDTWTQEDAIQQAVEDSDVADVERVMLEAFDKIHIGYFNDEEDAS